MPADRFAIALALALAAAPARADETADAVARMMRIGSCNSPSFSPDGKRVAFLYNVTGTPQVWTVPSQGGWPTQVTALEDPVGNVEWSPAGDLLAI